MDYILHQKPNISTITTESFIMYSHNKTAKWLNAKSTAEKNALFRTVKKQSHQVKEEFRQRQLEINRIRRTEAIKEMERAEEQRKKKQRVREERQKEAEETEEAEMKGSE
jgi:hypothetical protein